LVRAKFIACSILVVLVATPAWAWFAEGHEIVGIIAADGLTPTARSHAAQILGVHDDLTSVERAMAAASIRPDTEFRTDPSTPPWHFIDICVHDSRQDLAERCPRGNCVTAKIEEYARRLREADYDKWAAKGDLAFLVHFVGDIHQPLHAATDGDRGGTCQMVDVDPPERNLHYAWDDAVVVVLQRNLGTHGASQTARKLEQMYPASADSFTWRPDSAEEIAWETHELAKSEVYGALGIPERPCSHRCAFDTDKSVTLSSAYMLRAGNVAGRQLAKAGHRLASLLNQIWKN
jgi:hypothetical protein